MAASTRRAALGAILAAPLASMPAVAATSTVSGDEARFLALAPRLIALLDEYDRLWLLKDEPYATWEAAREKRFGQSYRRETEETPEYHAYIEARRPADELDAILEELYEPFQDIRLVTIEAIMLRHRYGMTFETFRDDVLEDLDAIWRARACA